MDNYVKKVDDLLKLRHVLVSCTDKRGLIDNEGMPDGYPQKGLLGTIAEFNSDVVFIATGKTYELIKNSNLRVREVADYINFPEMKTGMVKTLHPVIYAGILGNKYVDDDSEFFAEHGINEIDAVVVNFYNLYEKNLGDDFEEVRQAIDIGGPTMCHAARKSFLNTAIISSPELYKEFCEEIMQNNGSTTLRLRFKLAQNASKILSNLMRKIEELYCNVTYEDLSESYVINAE